MIPYDLERAWHLAQNGRPGPCWLDIPVDVQSAQIEPGQLRHHDPAEDAVKFDRASLASQVKGVLARISKAQRPDSLQAAVSESQGLLQNSNG